MKCISNLFKAFAVVSLLFMSGCDNAPRAVKAARHEIKTQDKTIVAYVVLTHLYTDHTSCYVVKPESVKFEGSNLHISFKDNEAVISQFQMFSLYSWQDIGSLSQYEISYNNLNCIDFT